VATLAGRRRYFDPVAARKVRCVEATPRHNTTQHNTMCVCIVPSALHLQLRRSNLCMLHRTASTQGYDRDCLRKALGVRRLGIPRVEDLFVLFLHRISAGTVSD
jgi:hypothetical protein